MRKLSKKAIGRTKMDSSRAFKRAYTFQNNNKFETWGECLSHSWAIERNNVITFEDIYNEHYNKYFHFISSKINSSEAALEITQDLFVKIHNFLPSFNPSKAKITTYMGTLSNNMVIDYYRLNNKRYNNTTNIENFVDDEGNEFFSLPVEDKQNDNKDINLTINQAINNINNPKLEAVANLYFIEQQKYNEIAEYLNIPLGSVKGYVNRVRNMLQTDLKHLVAA